MCFSATASFMTSAALLLVGVASWRRALPNQKAFAAIPFFFSLQQFTEGIIWVLLQKGMAESLLLTISKYVYLFHAYLFWPVWFPIAMLAMDYSLRQSKIVWAALATGSVGALTIAAFILREGASVALLDGHLYYSFAPSVSMSWMIAAFIYLAIVTIPFFVSQYREFHWFGVLTIASFAASMYYWTCCFTSIWCFWAALQSIMIYYCICKQQARYPSPLENS